MNDAGAPRLIVTADDFGASVEINQAVEDAHRHGCLTAASLMVTGAALDDAVARARALPALGVGLHLVLVEGRPALPPDVVPLLVGDDGLFRTDMARMGVDIFVHPGARRQLAAEIEAQFARFTATGLPLDHVNAHKHFHLHPTISTAVLRIGRRFGLKAMRAPVEPAAVLDAIEPGRKGGVAERLAGAYARRLATRLRRQGIIVPDQVFGLRWSGALTTDRLAGLVERLPPGLTEIYCHPATSDDFPGHASGYRYADEWHALVDQDVLSRITASRAALARFSDVRTPIRFNPVG